jgi:hypothetical protein
MHFSAVKRRTFSISFKMFLISSQEVTNPRSLSLVVFLDGERDTLCSSSAAEKMIKQVDETRI